MTLPNFLFIGAPRSGTTYIYHCLKQHPGIFLPTLKEPSFFSYDPENPKFADLYDKLDAAYGYKLVRSMEEYVNIYSEVKNEQVIGDSSANYISFPGTADRIHEHIPDAKILASLRNPVDAICSLYNWAYMNQLIPMPFTSLSVKEQLKVIDDFKEIHFNPYMYNQHLSEYFSLFDRSKMKIIIFEEWIKDKAKGVQDIFDFLEVDATCPINYKVDEFKSDMGVSSFPKRVMRRLSFDLVKIIRPFSKNIAQTFKRKIKKKFATKPPPITSETRSELLKLYRDDILKLQDLLDKDLSLWLE